MFRISDYRETNNLNLDSHNFTAMVNQHHKPDGGIVFLPGSETITYAATAQDWVSSAESATACIMLLKAASLMEATSLLSVVF